MSSQLDPKQLRRCFAQFATGVTVVTTRAEGAVHGLTVNSFTSVSLDPPLVLVSIDERTRARTLLDGRPFTVNVLAYDQQELALHFAGAAPALADIAWEEGATLPRLAGCIAYLECSPWRAYEGGDHTLFLGRVERHEAADGEPLVFFQGRFQPVERAAARPVGPWDWAHGTGWLGDEPLFNPCAGAAART